MLLQTEKKLEWRLLATTHDKQVPPRSAQQLTALGDVWFEKDFSDATVWLKMVTFELISIHAGGHAAWKMVLWFFLIVVLIAALVLSSNDQMMMFESWVHPAGVVMGSRWLLVPTPTAQEFSQTGSESKSLHVFQVGVSKSLICPAPAYPER